MSQPQLAGQKPSPTPGSAAIVDRLTFGGNIIETGTDSYRLAHTKAPTSSRELNRPGRPSCGSFDGQATHGL
jgi:hypothetical protein